MNENCTNHPTIGAKSFCHNCGEYYCATCLNEGLEYYYCNKNECKRLLELELTEKRERDRRESLFADVWARLGAVVLDSLFLLVPNSVLAVALQLEVRHTIFDVGPWVLFTHPMFYIIAVLYSAFLESGPKQATLGKQILCIRVVDNDGAKLSIGRAFGRNLSKYFPGILFIGFFMISFTKKHQGLHDLLARTFVVPVRTSDPMLPETIQCAKCSELLELSHDERIKQRFICPECGAQAEMAANVEDTPDPIPDPHANSHRQLVDAAERTVSDLLSELNIDLKSPFRIGLVAFILYCFDLRIGQFFSKKAAQRFTSECVKRFADVASTSPEQFFISYGQYARAFYAVDQWFHHGGPSDRNEKFRGIVAAEKHWEIIANGPNADTTRRSNPNTMPQEPGGALSLMHLQTTAIGIGTFCKNLAEKGVRL